MESERKMNGTLQISKSGCTDTRLLPQYKKMPSFYRLCDRRRHFWLLRDKHIDQ